ncbi:hypothetical protein VNO77_43942 [Canavalia gladiata]|uniref:Uncharacterized protein n=1 Tax=Canavalia gladiata TaxID=3824 RepID=A0AAN9JXD0_CANGL
MNQFWCRRRSWSGLVYFLVLKPPRQFLYKNLQLGGRTAASIADFIDVIQVLVDHPIEYRAGHWSQSKRQKAVGMKDDTDGSHLEFKAPSVEGIAGHLKDATDAVNQTLEVHAAIVGLYEVMGNNNDLILTSAASRINKIRQTMPKTHVAKLRCLLATTICRKPMVIDLKFCISGCHGSLVTAFNLQNHFTIEVLHSSNNGPLVDLLEKENRYHINPAVTLSLFVTRNKRPQGTGHEVAGEYDVYVSLPLGLDAPQGTSHISQYWKENAVLVTHHPLEP